MAFREDYAEARPVAPDAPVRTLRAEVRSATRHARRYRGRPATGPRTRPAANARRRAEEASSRPPPRPRRAAPRGARRRRLRGLRLVDRRPLPGLDRRRLRRGRHHDPRRQGVGLCRRGRGREQPARRRPGEVIARIDDGDYRLAVQAAKDKLATQHGHRRAHRPADRGRAGARSRRPSRRSTRRAADAVRTAADFERQSRLSQSDFASKARARAVAAPTATAAIATVKGAEAALRRGARPTSRCSSAQQVEAERTRGRAADRAAPGPSATSSFTVIRAPVAGVVGNRAVEVGSYVQPGTRLAALVPLDERPRRRELQGDAARPHPARPEGAASRSTPSRAATSPARSRASRRPPASQFSLLPPENATGNFTKIVQRVPVRIEGRSGEVGRRGAAAARPVGRRRRSTRATGPAGAERPAGR